MSSQSGKDAVETASQASGPESPEPTHHSTDGRDANVIHRVWKRWQSIIWSLPGWLFAPEPRDLDEPHSEWKEIHNEASKTVRRVFLSLLAISLFCILTLANSSDTALLLEASPTVTLPLINYDVSYPVFLIVAPLLLLALTFYLHVFVIHTRRFKLRPEEQSPILPNMDSFPARCITWILYYWITPLTLAYFVWKAKPHGVHGPLLLWVTLGLFVFLILVQARRCPLAWRPYVLPLLVLALIGSFTGFPWILEQRKLNLSATQLSKDALRDLKPINFIGTVAVEATMVGWKLGDIDLTRSQFQDADLSEADLTGSTLKGVEMERAKLLGTKLINASLEEANMRKADLTGADLGGADLRFADLSYVTLIKADLRNAYLGGAYLNEANLSHAKLGHALLGSPEEDSGRDPTDFLSSILECALLNDADLTRVDFTAAKLIDTNLQRAVLVEAKLVDATLDGADLSGAILEKANFQGSSLNGAALADADLTGANLTKTELVDADLRGAVLANANLIDATLDGADLSGAVLDNADLRGASLKGTVLTEASMLEVKNLTREQLETACGSKTLLPKGMTIDRCDESLPDAGEQRKVVSIELRCKPVQEDEALDAKVASKNPEPAPDESPK